MIIIITIIIIIIIIIIIAEVQEDISITVEDIRNGVSKMAN